MMLLLRVILLAAAAAPAVTPMPVAPLLPFPAPYLGPISVDAKFASGPIITIDPSGKSLTMNTLAGPLKVIIEPSTRVLGVDSKPIVLKYALRPTMYIRVYFVVREGARVEELDLLPAPMR